MPICKSRRAESSSSFLAEELVTKQTKSRKKDRIDFKDIIVFGWVVAEVERICEFDNLLQGWNLEQIMLALPTEKQETSGMPIANKLLPR
mmetsp:Transcript_123830/g.346780  ORF Transcript_123830/g.346780 Transcript_123830/m.346780 type:complete len:90 (-) Transcript_123830:12-281(-)